jgi:hypothetical protein
MPSRRGLTIFHRRELETFLRSPASPPAAKSSRTMNPPNFEPNPMVCHDFGKLLQDNPELFRINCINSVTNPYFLVLELMVVLSSHDPAWRHVRSAKINCIHAVDYAVRPKPPEIIEGGKFVEYYEEHPRLKTVSQCVPHSDGMKYFKPPVKFKLLVLENTWVIAARFELLLPPVRTTS